MSKTPLQKRQRSDILTIVVTGPLEAFHVAFAQWTTLMTSHFGDVTINQPLIKTV
jgi:hypothetical protein